MAEEKIPPGADVVVEATGSAEGFAAARALVRPRDILVLKSTLCLSQWQCESERTPHARLALRPNTAAVGLDDLFGDG